MEALVIGAGWNGLYAAKTLKALGYDVTVLEARSAVGGVWNLNQKNAEDRAALTASTFTELTSSRLVTQAHDFPYTKDMGDFPNAEKIMVYLEAYRRSFDICVQYNTRVKKVYKENDSWVAITTTASTHDTKDSTNHHRGNNGDKTYKGFQRLVVATGLQSSTTKQCPPAQLIRTFQGYTGERYSYQSFRNYADFEKLRDKRVLVIGGGESASELLLHICRITAKADWSNRGFHAFKKRGVQTSSHITAYDHVDTLWHHWTTGLFRFGKLGLRNACALASSGSILYPQGHSVSIFQRKERWGTHFFTKNAEVLVAINKEVMPRAQVCGTHGQLVKFADGNEETYDAIILCTGRQFCAPDFAPFLPDPKDCFKYMINMEDPTMAYAGAVRPTIGSIPLMTEYGLAVLEHFWSIQAGVPDPNFLRKENKKFARLIEIFFDGQRGIDTLVDPVLYWHATRNKYTHSKQSSCDYKDPGRNGIPLFYQDYSNLPVYKRRWTLVTTYLIPMVACCMLDEIIHLASDILPDSIKVLITMPNLDNTIFLTKNKEVTETVNYWRTRGYTVHEVDAEFEENYARKLPMIKNGLTLLGILALESTLWYSSSMYYKLAICRITWIVFRVLQYRYQVWQLA